MVMTELRQLKPAQTGRPNLTENHQNFSKNDQNRPKNHENSLKNAKNPAKTSNLPRHRKSPSLPQSNPHQFHAHAAQAAHHRP